MHNTKKQKSEQRFLLFRIILKNPPKNVYIMKNNGYNIKE